MTYKSFLLKLCLFIVLVGLSGVTTAAYGQTSIRGLDCAGIYDAIITLPKVSFDTPTVWRALEGDELGFDQFRDVAKGPVGTLVGAGVTSSEENKTLSPFIMAFSSKGDIKWENRSSTDSHKTIEAIVRIDDQYIAVGNLENPETNYNGIHVAYYDREGKITSEKEIFDDVYDFYAMDIAKHKDDGSVTILGWADNPADRTDKFSFLMQLDKTGEIVRRRNYQPGPNNKLLSLTRLFDGSYMAAGWIMLDDGRKAGWGVRMGKSGYLMWQRSYRRGKNAVLNKAVPHPNEGLVLIGESEPTQPPPNDQTAAWGMWVSPSGEPVWQRFWRSEYHLSGQDGISVDGNRLQILVQAKADDVKKRDHVKILTLTLRGQLIGEEAYMEGGNTVGKTLVKTYQGHRSVAGYAQTVFSMGDPDAPGEVGIYDAWLLMANAPEPFTDPCKPGAQNTYQ